MDDLEDNERAVLTRRIMKSYIDGGGLKESLREAQLSCFPIVCYVSYCHCTLRILVCGQCPGCDAPFVRNICNARFCEEIKQVIQNRFPVTQHVKPVFTHNDDLASIVAQQHLRIRNVINPTDAKTGYDIMKHMLDYNPYIDGIF